MAASLNTIAGLACGWDFGPPLQIPARSGPLALQKWPRVNVVATLGDVTGLVVYFNVAFFVLRGTVL